MPTKLSVLRACRRVLQPGGRLAFLTIQPAAGLSPRQRRRANEIGPPHVAVRTSYQSLLRSAGFVDVEAADVTSAYRATQVAWIRAIDRREEAVRAVLQARPDMTASDALTAVNLVWRS